MAVRNRPLEIAIVSRYPRALVIPLRLVLLQATFTPALPWSIRWPARSGVRLSEGFVDVCRAVGWIAVGLQLLSLFLCFIWVGWFISGFPWVWSFYRRYLPWQHTLHAWFCYVLRLEEQNHRGTFCIAGAAIEARKLNRVIRMQCYVWNFSLRFAVNVICIILFHFFY